MDRERIVHSGELRPEPTGSPSFTTPSGPGRGAEGVVSVPTSSWEGRRLRNHGPQPPESSRKTFSYFFFVDDR